MIPWQKGRRKGKPEKAQSNGFAFTWADTQMSLLAGGKLKVAPVNPHT